MTKIFIKLLDKHDHLSSAYERLSVFDPGVKRVVRIQRDLKIPSIIGNMNQNKWPPFAPSKSYLFRPLFFIGSELFLSSGWWIDKRYDTHEITPPAHLSFTGHRYKRLQRSIFPKIRSAAPHIETDTSLREIAI
jgi:hypothetical protein